MPKYLMLWSLNKSLLPANPKERGGGWTLLMEMIKNDMKNGVIKDWGVFTSQGAGYSIMEGSNLDVMKVTEQYIPYVSFEPRPIATMEEVLELIQHLSK